MYAIIVYTQVLFVKKIANFMYEKHFFVYSVLLLLIFYFFGV